MTATVRRATPEDAHAIADVRSWNTGAGLALMEAGGAWLGERYAEAVLWVAEENPQARRFYERYGWIAESTRVEEVVPGAHVSEVRYRLSLAER
jgi:hypothetical protein